MTRRSVAAAVWIVLLAASVSLAADEYRLGPGDVLSVAVWERPELTRNVTVRMGGQITFPPLGEIRAAGETAGSLARTLEDRLNEFLRRPTQVTVEIVEFRSQRVTVSGAVASPGRLSFEQIPGMVEILGAAGGLGPEADLSAVQIFRTREHQQTTITVDLTRAMASGDLSGLPKLEASDVIFVPSAGGEVGQAANAVYVTGEVASPGAYGIGSGMELLKIIALAGGTSPLADMKRVQVVSQAQGGATYVAEVDLERYLEHGVSSFVVRPGDAVWVPSRERTAAGLAWNLTRDLLGVSRDILNLFLISDVLEASN
jgi:polysaccharide export outer membrane protein